MFLSLSLFTHTHTHTYIHTYINHIFLEVIRGVSVRSFEKWKSSKLICPRYFSLDENNLFCLIYLSYTLRTPNIKIQTSSAIGFIFTFFFIIIRLCSAGKVRQLFSLQQRCCLWHDMLSTYKTILVVLKVTDIRILHMFTFPIHTYMNLRHEINSNELIIPHSHSLANSLTIHRRTVFLHIRNNADYLVELLIGF